MIEQVVRSEARAPLLVAPWSWKSQNTPKKKSNSAVARRETTIEPRQPSLLEKQKNVPDLVSPVRAQFSQAVSHSPSPVSSSAKTAQTR